MAYQSEKKAERTVIGRSADRFSLINHRNINEHLYTRTLISEALRVGLLPIETIDDVQMQIMGKLEILLKDYRKKNGVEPDETMTKHLLDSVFYTIDRFLLSFHDPMYAITAIQSTSIEEMFQSGRKQLKALLCETVSLYVHAKRSRIPCKALAYNRVLDEEIHAYLHGYDYLYAAQDKVCALNYPLLADGKDRGCGIVYLKDYLRLFETENKILQLFDPEERDLLFSSYAEKCGMTVEQLDVNLLTLVLNNAFGASMLGKYTGILTLTEEETTLLYQKLYRKTTRELETFSADAVTMMIADFHLRENDMLHYLRIAGRRFAGRLVEARNAGNDAGLFVSSDPILLFNH